MARWRQARWRGGGRRRLQQGGGGRCGQCNEAHVSKEEAGGAVASRAEHWWPHASLATMEGEGDGAGRWLALVRRAGRHWIEGWHCGRCGRRVERSEEVLTKDKCGRRAGGHTLVLARSCSRWFADARCAVMFVRWRSSNRDGRTTMALGAARGCYSADDCEDVHGRAGVGESSREGDAGGIAARRRVESRA